MVGRGRTTLCSPALGTLVLADGRARATTEDDAARSRPTDVAANIGDVLDDAGGTVLSSRSRNASACAS